MGVMRGAGILFQKAQGLKARPTTPAARAEGTQILDEFIISHRADLDGVASALLLFADARRRGASPSVLFVDYDDAEALIIAEIAEQQPDKLFIADISLRDESFIDNLPFSKDDLTIFDHHASSAKCWAAWDDRATIYYSGNGTHCTADLIGSYLIREYGDAAITPEMEEIIRAAHSRDLWIRDNRNGEMLSDVIAVLGADETFWEIAERGNRPVRAEEFTEPMNSALTTCHAMREESKQLACETRYCVPVTPRIIKKALEIRLVVTAECSGHESEVAEMLMGREDFPCWIGLVNPRRGILSFRCSRGLVEASGIAVNKIAEQFGGGGHPYASGAPIPEAEKSMDAARLAHLMKGAITAMELGAKNAD
jgi:oligoribonuclease NrnB/cAMP/cGMP phosphodiesterase (DHH superfamily)